ncbi:hypothetical protein ASPWEDRAFT_158591 [Aspergillus wentii DTO 134E9]|uniref:C2H2-type domain-containing protein n=1 Tax=Aspergillus wentii DTO 134E9 TaxID=1073089 RepID=A0A1L9RCI8_ASPWE|nr:uncharacterized protein ASPWEDRAFT_158591 [Aspergillus wentii DTO 134E9]OJJ32583.1 hypothetical protein ASPWEDRAFT_158591 [Aspergillus wentii DTO 134E9]
MPPTLFPGNVSGTMNGVLPSPSSLNSRPTFSSSEQEDWLAKEDRIDVNKVRQRTYSDNSEKGQDWVWTLWCRFCEETKREPTELMVQDNLSIATLYNFWDYTLEKRRKHIEAASTLQTYWNIWTTERRKRTDRSLPSAIKDGMIGVRDQLVRKYDLRTDSKQRPHARSEDVFELQMTLWMTGGEPWDPLQLAVFMLLAGPTAHRRTALLTLRHCDIFLTLLPDPSSQDWPQMVVEIQPDKTKRYRSRKKRTPKIALLEVPGETCLFLCPKTFLLGLLLRKGAFRHMGIVSAEQLDNLRIPPDARELPLKLADPESLLFDMTQDMLDSYLERLGELTGYDHRVTSKWFRRGAGEAVNSSTEISEAQQNLLMQHRTGTVYQDNYAPDHLPGDVYSAWRGQAPQREIVRMTSGQSRTIRKDRPVDLTDAQKAEAMNDPDVQRHLKRWLACKASLRVEYGSFSRAEGTKHYQEALQQRNKYHTAIRVAKKAKKREVRALFNEEQPVADVWRQVHGLPFKAASQQISNTICPEQCRAFELVFRFAPESSQDNRRCRAAVSNALSQVNNRSTPSHGQTASRQSLPLWPSDTNSPYQMNNFERRQCPWCVRTKLFKNSFSLRRHINRRHSEKPNQI